MSESKPTSVGQLTLLTILCDTVMLAITCRTVVDERVSKANSSFTETSGSNRDVM